MMFLIRCHVSEQTQNNVHIQLGVQQTFFEREYTHVHKHTNIHLSYRIRQKYLFEVKVYNTQSLNTHLPGHAFGAQVRVSVARPGQSAPPYAGDGFVQVRDLVWVPDPQVTGQAPQFFHPDHLPLTGSGK